MTSPAFGHSARCVTVVRTRGGRVRSLEQPDVWTAKQRARRLFALGYPRTQAQLWDLETGERFVVLELGMTALEGDPGAPPVSRSLPPFDDGVRCIAFMQAALFRLGALGDPFPAFGWRCVGESPSGWSFLSLSSQWAGTVDVWRDGRVVATPDLF
jgi:hypothetical protein